MDGRKDEFRSRAGGFKTQIDLRQYAASIGFALIKDKSSRSSAVMRRDADKIIIRCNTGDGHYVYFTVHDDADNGSIIDFVKNRLRKNIGEVRKELRPWIGRPATSLSSLPPLEKSSKDRGLVETQFGLTTEARTLPYLETEGGLFPALPASSRFAVSGRMSAAMPFSLTSIGTAFAGTRRKTLAIRVFPGAAKKGSGSVTPGRAIVASSFVKEGSRLSLMRSFSRMRKRAYFVDGLRRSGAELPVQKIPRQAFSFLFWR